MIGLIFKHWKKFLDVILVVGGILAFTFFDPLGIFNNTKLQATANMVTGVKDIGQLVTAEYYGEVISSWKEFKLTEIPEDTISQNAEDLFVALKVALGDVNKGFKKQYNDGKIAKLKKDYGDEYYYKFLTFLGDNYLGFDAGKVFDEKDSDLKRNYEKKILNRLYDKGRTYYKFLKKEYKDSDKLMVEVEYDNYLNEIPDFIEDFYNFHGFLTKKHLESGSNKRKEIVFIGRGWVKAGFDFGKLNEGNFMYDESNKSVHFFGIKPVILDTDINPWFIPERKVKGFELVDYSGKVNFEDAKAVKKQCKEKLLEQARRADIVARAQENGEEALRNFFSIILDEPDLKVQFHLHPFDLHYAIIAADTLIDINEALFIQSLYQDEMDKFSSPDSEESASMISKREKLLEYFINQLKELHFLEKDQPFNYYSMYAAYILRDTFHISHADRLLLIDLRDTLKIDSNDTLKLSTLTVRQNPSWFKDGKFRYEFKQTMELLKNEALSFDSTEICKLGDSILVSDNDSLYYVGKCDKVMALDTLEINGLKYYEYNASNTLGQPSTFLDDIQYDMDYPLQINDSIKDTTEIATILNEYRKNKKYNKSIDTLNRAEISVIIKAKQNKVIYDKKVGPINNLVAGVETFIEKIKKK